MKLSITLQNLVTMNGQSFVGIFFFYFFFKSILEIAKISSCLKSQMWLTMCALHHFCSHFCQLFEEITVKKYIKQKWYSSAAITGFELETLPPTLFVFRVWPCVWEVLREDSMYDEVVQMGSVHLITQAELPAVTARGSRIPISAEANTHPIILFEYLDI